MSGNVDVMDLVRRAVKYLFEGLVVAFVAGILPKKPLSMEEILHSKNCLCSCVPSQEN